MLGYLRGNGAVMDDAAFETPPVPLSPDGRS
jgi:hypothetical protein